MKIADYVDENHIIFLEEAHSKEELLEIFSERFDSLDAIEKDKVFNALLEREKLSSTAVGDGVAIPHAKVPDVDDLKILIAISKVDQDFDAMDNQPVRLFFVVVAPTNQMQLHLKALARISRLLKMTDFKKRVLNATDPKEIINILIEEESKL